MIPFPPGPFTPDVLLLAAGLVFAGYLLFGITGFGASFVTVPVLSHSLPLPYLLSLSTLLDFWAALALSWRHRRDVAYAELARMLPFTLAGSAAGLALLVSLPRAVIMGALGLFVVGNSLWSLRAQRSTAPVHRAWAVPAGLVGGVFGSLFGVGGPPQVIYITRRLGDSPRLRPTIAMTVVFASVLRSDLPEIERLIAKHFDLRPAAIIDGFDLRRPIYRQTAAYGHFGRPDLDLPWERLDKVDALRKDAGLA